MKYKVELTRKAHTDIKEIILYINKAFGEEKASEVLEEMYERIKLLSQAPDAGFVPRMKSLLMQGYKVLILEKNLVFYTVDKSKHIVYIERVVNSRQDYKHIINSF